MRGPEAQSTRDIVIMVAERLFSEQGIDAVSLREVIQVAGQRNMGLVRYYFGGKDELVRAIFDWRSAVTDDRRRAMLCDLEARGTMDVRSLAAAVVVPLAEQLGDDNRYVEFCARLLVERGRLWMSEVAGQTSLATYGRIEKQLQRVLAPTSSGVVTRRLGLAIELTVHALAGEAKRLRAKVGPSRPPKLFTEDLVAVVASVLATPSVEQSQRLTS